MTENQDVCRAKAKGRTELLASVVFLLLLGGAAAEYRRETMPLATASFIFETEKSAENENNYVSGTRVSGLREAEIPKNAAVSDNSEQNLSDFLNYIREIKEKKAALQRPESALNKIHQSEAIKPELHLQPPVFEEGKIEIYDSKKGVVAVESTLNSAEEKHKEQKYEEEKETKVKNTSGDKAETVSHSLEQQAENNVSSTEAPVNLMEAVVVQQSE